MRYVLVCLFLAGCVAKTSDKIEPLASDHVAPSQTIAPSIEHQLARLIDPECPVDSFARFELVPIPGSGDRFAAICDWEYMWWGCACYFEMKNGVVSGLCVLEQGEQSMFTIRCIRLPGHDDPFLELFGKTHMGHGAYYLHRVTPVGPELAIETTAVDFHHDLDVLWGGMLRPVYRDINLDGWVDVELTGTRMFEDDENSSNSDWDQREKIRKAFLFSRGTGGFVEDQSRRLGNKYHN